VFNTKRKVQGKWEKGHIHYLPPTIILRTDTLEALEEFLVNGKGWDSAIMKLIEQQEGEKNE
jgi:hypothetical protein